METLIAFCGLTCSECPAYIATLQDNQEARETLAVLWSTDAFPLAPADISCDGCTLTGQRLLPFCKGCDIRTCALEHEVFSCADCLKYPCGKLEKVHPEARALLDRLWWEKSG